MASEDIVTSGNESDNSTKNVKDKAEKLDNKLDDLKAIFSEDSKIISQDTLAKIEQTKDFDQVFTSMEKNIKDIKKELASNSGIKAAEGCIALIQGLLDNSEKLASGDFYQASIGIVDIMGKVGAAVPGYGTIPVFKTQY